MRWRFMSFAVGDRVRILALNKPGQVSRILKGGRYRISLGALQIDCREEDLEADAQKKKGPGRVASETMVVLPGPAAQTVRRLDLHGLRVTDALRQVESAVNRAILCNQNKLEIMHGIGSGKIKEALHGYLKELVVVKSFRLEPENPGVTVVYF